MRLKIIIPVLLVPLVAIGVLFSGVLSADSLPFLREASDAIATVTGQTDEQPAADADEDPESDGSGVGTGTEGTTGAQPGEEPPGPPAADAPLITATEGYLNGTEHGVALIQTTRVDNPEHQGWVHITLDLVLTSYSTDPAFNPRIGPSKDGTRICFTNSIEPNDCFSVWWGSVEQFKAVLQPSQSAAGTWPVQKAWPYTVTFEVPANATRASFIYGTNRVEINLQGDPPTDFARVIPATIASAPVDANAPAWTAGYYLTEQHGVAVTGTRRLQHGTEPTWARIEVDLAAITLADGPAFDLPLSFQNDAHGICFTTDGTRDCIRILWGPVDQFDAVLSSTQGSGQVPWPRRKAWPTTVSFPVPANVTEATLVFGRNSVPLDLRGSVGPVPPWNYRAHYFQLAPEITLYSSEDQTITLMAIDHDTVTGDATLVFKTVNDKENADFFPRITASAARVSAGGRVFDGLAEPPAGWRPSRVQVQGSTLAPGQKGVVELRLPRVEGPGFAFVPHAESRPDAMLLRLFADNNAAGSAEDTADAERFEPIFVPFDRNDEGSEATFFFPDLVPSAVTIDVASPTAGDLVALSFTIENRGPRDAPATTIRLDASGNPVVTVPVPAIAAGQSARVDIPWTAAVKPHVLTGTVDPDGGVAESNNDNNSRSFAFAGGSLPDLIVSNVSFSSASPSVGDTVEITVTVTNVGAGRSDRSRVAAYLNSPSITFFIPYPGLSAGASSSFTFSWTAMPGPFPMTFTADGFADVAEADETNNTLGMTHNSTQLADLVVVDVTFDTEVIAVGETVTFTVHTRNAGPGRAAGSTLLIYVEDAEDPEFSFTLPSIPSGGTVEASFQFEIVHGLTEFRAVNDPTDAVPETDETNNVAAFSF